jgi:chromosome transmission fidelity protein 4
VTNLFEAIALSDSYVVATTSINYVRIYTLFGVPYRIFRSKSTPAVTCAAWRDYVLTMGNGPVGADGSAKLLYTIENVRRDDICQSEDVVALPENGDLRTVFFSDDGDPYIYDSNGVLLVLQHWRTPGQARWVPLLDTKLLERLASGKKEETYWPVAVAQEKFHCIILKGGDRYPYFPRPLLTEFEFQIPISSLSTKPKLTGEEDDEEIALTNEVPRLEESYMRHSILHSLQADLLTSTHPTHTQRAELAKRELEIDKALLQLLNVECREGEERGMKALEIVSLLQDAGGSGKMLEAARKIAERYGRHQLVGKIEEVAEQRMMQGMEEL